MEVQGSAALAVTITLAIVEAVKRAPYFRDNDWTYPLLALAIGLLMGGILTAVTGADLLTTLSAGLGVALTAMGVYSGGKTLIKAVANRGKEQP